MIFCLFNNFFDNRDKPTRLSAPAILDSDNVCEDVLMTLKHTDSRKIVFYYVYDAFILVSFNNPLIHCEKLVSLGTRLKNKYHLG